MSPPSFTSLQLFDFIMSNKKDIVIFHVTSWQRLANQLENQANVTDPSARMRTQASALRTGALFHNLGACLLELGRTMMTLQMGQTPVYPAS